MSLHRVAGFALVVVLVGCTSTGEDSTATTETADSPTSGTDVVSTTVSEATTVPDATTTSETPRTTVPLSELHLSLTEVGSGFNNPVLLVQDPAGGHDFVVEQPGRIVRADGEQHTVALDLRDLVRFGGEQGLLGLAFHPDFAQNGLAYVNYVDSRGRTVIAQFEVHDGVFDVAFDPPVLVIDQPAANHNGGMIAFGPRGYLWIGMGDGGSADDRFNNGQDPHTLLGSMLRISVPSSSNANYDIPDLNPYADGVDGAPEVYWTGVRNPWRFAFDFFEDGLNADVWIADVGQGEIEEISVMHSEERHANFGWPIMEGSECFQSEDCDRSALVLPVAEYRHDEGCSITGGYVYRGSAIPELDGHFFYADFCTGIIRSYSPASGDHDWTSMLGAVAGVSSFGIGGDGELYVVSLGGTIYRLERAE
jgi:glucose/arabinose dehydrogenase